MEFEETGVQQSSDGIEYTHKDATTTGEMQAHPDVVMLQQRESGMQVSVYDQLQTNRMKEEEEKLEMEKASRGQAKLDKDEAKWLGGIEAEQRAQHAAALAELEGARAEFMQAQSIVKLRSGDDVLRSLAVGPGLDLGDDDVEEDRATGTAARSHAQAVQSGTHVNARQQLPASRGRASNATSRPTASGTKRDRLELHPGHGTEACGDPEPELPSLPRRKVKIRLKRATEVLRPSTASSSGATATSTPACAPGAGAGAGAGAVDNEDEAAGGKRRRLEIDSADHQRGGNSDPISSTPVLADAGRGGIGQYDSSSDEDNDEER